MESYCNRNHRGDKFIFILINLFILITHSRSNENGAGEFSKRNALGPNSQLAMSSLGKIESSSSILQPLSSHFSRHSDIKSAFNFMTKSSSVRVTKNGHELRSESQFLTGTVSLSTTSKVTKSSESISKSGGIDYSSIIMPTDSTTQSISFSKYQSSSLKSIHQYKNSTHSQKESIVSTKSSISSSAIQSSYSGNITSIKHLSSSAGSIYSIMSTSTTSYTQSPSMKTSSTSTSAIKSSSAWSSIVTPHSIITPTITVTVCPWDTLITANILPSSHASYIISSSLVIKNSSDIKPAKKGCDVTLQGLSNAMANISYCIMRYSHPMEVCRKCTGSFTTMETYHTLVYKNCGKELISDYFEQYQIIPKMYAFQHEMWNKLNCDKCYKGRDKNDPKAPWIPTDAFKMFEKLLAEAMRCFANHSKIHLPYPVTVNNSHSANSTKTGICIQCKGVYEEFRELVKSSDEKETAEKKWCADVVYGLNETRKIWASNCVEKRGDMQSIIALTCFFCFIPIVFYVGTKLHSDVKDRKNESRLSYESD